jgi:DNA-binding IclR family transcriptional regulator
VSVLGGVGLQLDFETERGVTALIAATRDGNATAIAALTKSGAVVDIQATDAYLTALIIAAQEEVSEPSLEC